MYIASEGYWEPFDGGITFYVYSCIDSSKNIERQMNGPRRHADFNYKGERYILL